MRPRLSWILTSDQRGQKQTAYQVLVSSTAELLARNQGDLWNSGKVSSDQSIQVEYLGKPLVSRMGCHWKVRVWDKEGKISGWSSPAFWSMGLLHPEDWQAKWIGRGGVEKRPGVLDTAHWIWFPEGDPASNAPVETYYFRRSLLLPEDRVIARATCYITADNVFDLFINGHEAGNGKYTAVAQPPSEFDVTGLLKNGPNLIAVRAANEGGPAGLIATLRVEYMQGQTILISTDGEWKVVRERIEGWEQPKFDDARWASVKVIGPYVMAPWMNTGTREHAVPRYLRREFEITNQVSRATAYVCGLGMFDMFLNGQKVSDEVMNPALTDHMKAVFYVTFDVTEHLRPGVNAVGVILGNPRFWFTSPAPMFPKLLLQLELEYADGTRNTLVSDETWRLTADGPIRISHEYGGEEYDARYEMPGWDRAGFNDTTWEPVQLVDAPKGALQSQMLEPMRVTERVKPIAISSPAPGTYIVDMGQNFYGTVRLTASAPRGTEVHMTSAYSLMPDGTLKTADNRSARCTDVYTFKGEGTEMWAPRFKGQGYRRVQVTGFPGVLTTDNFEGLVIHSDVEPAGSFECSNDLVNRIHGNMRWGMRMFLRSAPLDPDRDERQPWVGDPAKDAESEAYNFNVASFYAKWMDDVRRSQRADGSLPDISMSFHGGDGVEWPSVFTIIPDWFTAFYGDSRVAQTNYEAMKTWVLAMRRHELADGTLKATSYGDWCDTYTIGGKISDFGATPRELISTAYQYNNCRIIERLAGQFGQKADQLMFARMAGKLKTAFNQKFLDQNTHVYGDGTQCAYVLPLAFGLVPEGQRDGVLANLIDDIMVKHNGHLSVGLIGMQWLMQTLTENGRPDVAWTIVTQTTRPSWGYMVSKGATTIWERWDMDTRDPGMNSEALLIQAGNLDAWFYQCLAGINYDLQQPGFKNVIIHPRLVGDLAWVKAHHDSPYGRIASAWKRENGQLTMDITIPVNSTAIVYVPTQDLSSVKESGRNARNAKGVKYLRMVGDAAMFAVGSGKYQFSSVSPENDK